MECDGKGGRGGGGPEPQARHADPAPPRLTFLGSTTNMAPPEGSEMTAAQREWG